MNQHREKYSFADAGVIWIMAWNHKSHFDLVSNMGKNRCFLIGARIHY